jgi:hypothetical protein
MVLLYGAELFSQVLKRRISSKAARLSGTFGSRVLGIGRPIARPGCASGDALAYQAPLELGQHYRPLGTWPGTIDWPSARHASKVCMICFALMSKKDTTVAGIKNASDLDPPTTVTISMSR